MDQNTGQQVGGVVLKLAVVCSGAVLLPLISILTWCTFVYQQVGGVVLKLAVVCSGAVLLPLILIEHTHLHEHQHIMQPAQVAATASPRPSLTDLNSMKKDPLKKLAQDLLAEINQLEAVTKNPLPAGEEPTLGHVLSVLIDIRQEITTFTQYKSETDTKITKCEKRITDLESENQLLNNALLQQQRFLESLDAEKRRNTIIITGLPEDTPLLSDPDPNGRTSQIVSDEDKVQHVFRKIGHGDKNVIM